MSQASTEFIHPAGPPRDDLNVLPSEGGGVLNDVSTGEALEMIMGHSDDDVWVGRMSAGFDLSDMEVMSRDRMTDTANGTEGRAGDELDLMAEDSQSLMPEVVHGDDEPVPFESPAETQFPVFKAALQKFSAAVAKPRVVRIDTEGTYGDYVSEKAVAEIARRVSALEDAMEEHDMNPRAHRAAFAEHNADPHAHMRQEVLGAVESFSSAKTPREAAASLPQVPLDIPDFAKGKVQCFRDGDCVVVSIHFQAADGSGRVATMAAKPTADVDELVGWAMRSGVNPVTILGALPDAIDVACGKRLLKDVAGAALKCQRRMDVMGMDEPVLLATQGNAATAPIAAIMHTQQCADAGDSQAQDEMEKLEDAAETVVGRKIGPVLTEAKRRLAKGKQEKAKRRWGFFERYSDKAMVLG